MSMLTKEEFKNIASYIQSTDIKNLARYVRETLLFYDDPRPDADDSGRALDQLIEFALQALIVAPKLPELLELGSGIYANLEVMCLASYRILERQQQTDVTEISEVMEATLGERIKILENPELKKILSDMWLYVRDGRDLFRDMCFD